MTLKSPHVNSRIGFPSIFVIWSIFFSWKNLNTGTKNLFCNCSPLLKHIISLAIIIFKKGDFLPYIAREGQNLVKFHFTDDCIISRAFPTKWLPCSSYLILCKFWIWDHLKEIFYSGNISNIADSKKKNPLICK